MATLIEDLTYTWVDNDVYKIDKDDPVEGAATSASFSGLGVDNEPHQQLVNKVRFVRRSLLAFAAQFTGTLANLGFLRIPVGSASILIQWGRNGVMIPAGVGFLTQQNFPVPFTTALFELWISPIDAGDGGRIVTPPMHWVPSASTLALYVATGFGSTDSSLPNRRVETQWAWLAVGV
jgi:hypothetical protein